MNQRIYESLNFYMDPVTKKRMVEIKYRILNQTKHLKKVTMCAVDLDINVKNEIIPLFDRVIDAIESGWIDV